MLAFALILALAPAQPESGWDARDRVEPGVGDMGILSESLRIVPLDLRIADDWGDLSRIQSEYGTLYTRRAGAVTAVFPQSNYIDTPFGTVPTIPADTVFVIGEPSPALLRQLGLALGDESILSAPSGRINSSLSTAIDGRVWTGIQPTRMGTSLAPPPAAPLAPNPIDERARALAEAQAEDQVARRLSMWFNDDVRRHRVDTLLARALRGDE
ncbi:MAG: hypothetical protein DYG94_09345 [Leptolyngbya sp. PLA3]|nr:MAG: hypothetical protein EDM82_11985 [Cyanobacteria bacterium CYA]MCE7968936.1 hypothetical protein [Leptolyngbya sp. PL-A3]